MYNSRYPESGPVAQLGARFNRTEEVEGSNPSRSIWTMDRGEVNPRLLPNKGIIGPIAQLGARLNGIEKAEGSNPSGSTQFNQRLDFSCRESI